MASGSKLVVYAALAGNLAVAATKTVAAVITGSSSMTSEAIHSFVDTGNEILLLYGMRRSTERPTRERPLGHGRELYFWSFVVALLFFTVGALVTFYEGWLHIAAPAPIEKPWISYAVLGAALLFEGGSFAVALRQFNSTKGERGWWEAIRRSKNPPEFMVLLEDAAAILGLLFALAGTWAATTFGDPRYDGYASIGISVLLATVSIILLRESKELLIGEQADPEVVREICDITTGMDGVVEVHGLTTSHLAPDQILVAMSVKFEDGQTVEDVERIVREIERRIREANPEVTALFVKPQTRRSFDEGVEHRVQHIEATREGEAAG